MEDTEGVQHLPDDPESESVSLQLRKSEEQHFSELFIQVAEEVKDLHSISYEDVERGVQALINAFKFSTGNRFSDVDLTRYENSCAYLFRNCPIFAGLTRYRLLETLTKCDELNKICLGERKEPLRVVSLAGGPGTDAVGFCSAIQQLGFPKSHGLEILVTDKVQQWEEFVNRVESRVRQGQFGNASELFRGDESKVTMNFVTAKLPLNAREARSAHKGLKKADIILLQQLLKNVLLSEVTRIMQNIRALMKDDALFLVINSPSIGLEEDGEIRYSGKVISGFELLYQSDSGEYSLLEKYATSSPLSEGLMSLMSRDLQTCAQIVVLRKVKKERRTTSRKRSSC